MSFSKCERYSLDKKCWLNDVPDFPEDIYSASFIKVGFKWIYGFGGENDYITTAYSLKVFRLNTSIIE